MEISNHKIRDYALLSLVVLAFIIIFFPVCKSLVRLWMHSDDNSYGVCIIPISAYLIWQKKEILMTTDIKPSNSGLALIILSLFLYILSIYAGVLTLAPFSIVVFIWGAVLYLFGYRVFKIIAFPLLFLVFLVPVPTQIYTSLTIPLQLLVSKVSVFIARLFDIPILREGNVIHMTDRTLQVVQACSGLRSLVALLMLCAVFGYMSLKNYLSRLLLFVLGLPVAVFVNIVRVLIMILAFEFFNYDLTEGGIHTTYGIVIFGLALGLIALINKVLVLWEKSAKTE